MARFGRFIYHPIMPLGKGGKIITGCKAHWKIAKDAATEGTVLLKNDGTLPLAKGVKVCLFGRGAGRYLGNMLEGERTASSCTFLFGGGGSGRVYTDKFVSLAEAMEASDQLEVFSPLIDFYTEACMADANSYLKTDAKTQAEWLLGHHHALPVLPEELYLQAKDFADTAIFCLSRFSGEGDRSGDRTGAEGDFSLTNDEKELLSKLKKDFSKVVVILNVTGPVSTKEYKEDPAINAVLYPMFGGGLAGESLVDILLGKAYPSGHLQDTIAETIEDYPSTKTFQESRDYVNYTEDIFVGYRYFETFAPEKVVYPYGFGLSYTTFQLTTESAVLDKNTVKLAVKVTNTGVFPGKEVVQAYLTAPQGKLGKAKKVLCAFAKTRELQPKEEATVKLSFDIREFGSFDDLGKVVKSAFVLEQGEYTISVGNNVRDTEKALTFTLDSDIVCRRCHSYMSPKDLKERLTANGTMEALPQPEPVKHPLKRFKLKEAAPEKPISLAKALQEDQLDAFIASLDDEELAKLLYGHPNNNAADTRSIGTPPAPAQPARTHNIPLLPTADGPAGVRVIHDCGMYPTFFPCANVVSQTWNPAIAYRIGAAGAIEAKENNIGIWLTPALNIHRSPLCGRNFEYYSEDPMISGVFAAASVQGIQSQKVAATVKHFCGNNKEINRRECDSRVSERALREIYLRGFEIAVKKGKPWALMTAYNKVNGVRSSANWESLNGILRGEWKYDGLVMTDWDVFSTILEEVPAGGDVKMPGQITRSALYQAEPYDLAETLKNGQLDRGAALMAVKRILTFMSKFE